MSSDELTALVNKFFSGDTTLSEEQTLYNAFRSGNVPAGLEKYRELFLDLGAAAAPAAESAPRRSRISIAWRAMAGVAAAAAVAAVVLLVGHGIRQQKLEATYSGSYMVVNGKRTDDLSKILPNIKKTLSDASKIETIAYENNMIEDAEQEAMKLAGNDEQKKEIEDIIGK